MTGNEHISVMPKEVLEYLALKPGMVIVDATLGLAGHSQLIAQQIGDTGHLIGLDRDSTSLAKAKSRLASLSLRIDLLKGSFAEIDRLIASVNVSAVDGVLMDLGISSFQLDSADRGFAFSVDGPLDMRMDATQGQSAADLVNTLSALELERIFWEWGEERFARRFAQSIVSARAVNRITTTKQLADLLLRSLPGKYQRGRLHPATRSFQGLRIAVNDELGVLTRGLARAFEILKTNGRLVVISFHSLEDRIVKNTFRRLSEENQGRLIVKKPLVPTEEECVANSRARSAKMRVIEKIV